MSERAPEGEGDREEGGREAEPGLPEPREVTIADLRDDEDFPPELAVISEAALERNAREPLLLDLRGLSDATDFFFVASGDSDVHARAIAEGVRVRMEEEGFDPVGVEGEDRGRWILVDYFNVVVHLFLPKVRDFYQLERLWGDAPEMAVRD